MAPTSEQFDWRTLGAGREIVTARGFRTRARVGMAVFLLLLLLVLTRVAVLERVEGARFRAAAAEPIQQTVPLPAPRGRILSADGAVLAADQTQATLAVHYRYLEQPPNPRWLRRQLAGDFHHPNVAMLRKSQRPRSRFAGRLTIYTRAWPHCVGQARIRGKPAVAGFNVEWNTSPSA